MTNTSFTELSLSAQTAYAQLMDAALALDHVRSVADLSGSFSAKTVRGAKYWYFQYTEPAGKLRQVYVGPDSFTVQALIAGREVQPSSKSLVPQVRSCIALGCSESLTRHLRVIHRLAEYGFFKAGAVLVGAHAFPAYGNMLGVQWGDNMRAPDVDITPADSNLTLALPRDFSLDTNDTIRALEKGLLPNSGLCGRSGATYLNPRDPDFRLDFLTPPNRIDDDPLVHERLGIPLHPFKYIQFLLENAQQAALIARDKAVVVNLPHPARYALHKLIIYGDCGGVHTAKGHKHLEQAAQLLARLQDTHAWEIEDAWAELRSRGKGWGAQVKRGRQALLKAYPEAQFDELLPL